MQVNTHLRINPSLVGEPVEINEGSAVARLVTTADMAADEHGLVHGGFAFGLADYTAMLAVNDPFVVLGAAEVRFTGPARVGDILDARATLQHSDGKKRTVECVVHIDDQCVFQGTFTCFVLEQHILHQ